MRFPGLDMSGKGSIPAWGTWGGDGRAAWLARWPGIVLLLAVCLTVYLPGFTSIPVVDRDEARFAQASRGMLESRDYVIPRIQGVPRLNKPPLIYWLQSASAGVLTSGNPAEDEIWMYRIPSLVGAMVVVLATRRLGAAMFGPVPGFLAGAMIAVAPVFFWEAHQARADMVMVACTTVAVLGLWRCMNTGAINGLGSGGMMASTGGTTAAFRPAVIYAPDAEDDVPTPIDDASQPVAIRAGTVDDAPRTFAAAFRRCITPSFPAMLLWFAMAAGILTKGPVTPMVLGLTVLAWCLVTRRVRWLLNLRPVLGIAIIVAAALPWLLLVVHREGWSNYLHIVRDETLGRSLAPKEGHSGFPGIHTLLFSALFFPGCLLTGTALWHAFRAAFTRASSGSTEDGRAQDGVQGPPSPFVASPSLFLMCVTLPSWLLFEAIGTRLPHYTMPLYPALAILTARACCMTPSAFSALIARPTTRWALTIWLLVVPISIVGAAGLLAFALRGVTGIGIVLTGLGVAAAFLACAGLALRARDMVRLQLIAVTCFAPALIMLGLALPRLDDLWISRELASQLRALDPTHQTPLAAVGSDAQRSIVGFQEDSLLFETRTQVQRIDPDQLNAWFRANPHGLAIVPAQMLVGETPYYPITRVDGFNYSKGRLTYLCIAQVRPK